MRHPVLRWLPVILAVCGLTIALVGLSTNSIRVFESPKNSAEAKFTVEVFGLTIHQHAVSRSAEEQARGHYESEFESNAKPWLIGIVVGFGAVFGLVGWVAAKMLGGGSAAPRSAHPAASEIPAEHAVIVQFNYGSTDLTALHALEDELEAALSQAGSGELDGNEVAVDGSDGRLYFYGPDADALLGAIKSTLESVAFMRGARATLRYGPPETGVKSTEVILGS